MDIVLDHTAQRQLKRTPKNIIKKLRDWVVSVMERGLREVAKQPGYHDEPLVGKRKGQRSIRLSRLWRAIYRPVPARITIETVTPHDYRVKGAAEVDALPFLNELLGEPTAAAEAQMDRTTKRQVLATLIRAGRRDLAVVVAGGDVVRKAAVVTAGDQDVGNFELVVFHRGLPAPKKMPFNWLQSLSGKSDKSQVRRVSRKARLTIAQLRDFATNKAKQDQLLAQAQKNVGRDRHLISVKLVALGKKGVTIANWDPWNKKWVTPDRLSMAADNFQREAFETVKSGIPYGYFL